MLSPYVKLNKNCSLCQKLLEKKNAPDFLFNGGHNICVYKSPFSEKWPGSIMIVYKRHIFEQSDIRASDLPDTMQSLICFEHAVRKATNCQRINFVKFGNETHHLHWHIIPRYSNELFPKSTPWELKNKTSAELYNETNSDSTKEIYDKISDISQHEINHKNIAYFGCAMFLRPIEEADKQEFSKLTLNEIIQKARRNPASWECLLMKRNYFDFAWDFVGGNSDPNEFPEHTMLREVKEELGWTIKEHQEVCRQWRNGAIKGFVYATLPSSKNYIKDDPPRTECDEVQTVKYFNLQHLVNDETFSDSVRGRVRAFLQARTDFFSVDS